MREGSHKLDDAIRARTLLYLSPIRWIASCAAVSTIAIDLMEGAPPALVGLRGLEFSGAITLLLLARRGGPRWSMWLWLMLGWWGFFDGLGNALALDASTAASSANLLVVGAAIVPSPLWLGVARIGSVAALVAAGLALGGITTPGLLGLSAASMMVGVFLSWIQYQGEVQAWQLREAALAASEARGRFLARVSHEMRTPLNGVMGMLRAIDGEPLSAQQRAALLAAEQSSALLCTTIDDVLAFAAGESGAASLSPEPVDVVALLERLLATAVPPEARGRVRLEAQPMPAWLEADPNRIQQVVLHLVDNGIRFSAGGEVVVRLSWDDQLIIDVLDEGPGLSAPLEVLVSPFSQGDETATRRYGGTGLGLALTMQLVSAMEGSLSATDRPGGGAHFTVRLPLPCVAAPRAAPPVVLCGAVLIVDDNIINRQVLRRMVESMGASVDEAEDGAQGLTQMQHRAYSLVLMDHHMPGMDGLEATRRARAAGVTSPIVAVTASSRPEARDDSRRAGMDAHLTKPISIAHLSAVLSEVLPDPSSPQRARAER